MQAVILAAGIASRLHPLTENRPKCLLEISGHTLLGLTIDALLASNVNNFIIVTGYLEEQIKEYIYKNYDKGLFRFITNNRYKKTNNIYSLWLATRYVKGEDFLLLDSDILFDPSIIKALLSSTENNILAMNCHELGEEEIKIIPDIRGQVKEISKTCSIKDAIGESVGIEKISADYSKALYEELKIMIESLQLDNIFYECAFERLIPKGFTFSILDTTSFFSMELDTVEDFKNAQKTKLSYIKNYGNL